LVWAVYHPVQLSADMGVQVVEVIELLL